MKGSRWALGILLLVSVVACRDGQVTFDQSAVGAIRGLVVNRRGQPQPSSALLPTIARRIGETA